MSRPQDDKPVYGGATLGTGDYAVIILTKIAVPETIFEKDIEDKQQQLQRVRAGADWNDFLKALHGRADVEVYNDRI